MTGKPRKDSRPAPPRQGPLYQTDPPLFVPVKEEATGYSVEDAYRVLAGLPLTPVETTPVE